MENDTDLVLDGSPGQGVATALVTGGTANVLNAFGGILNATKQSDINPVGHGQITVEGVHDGNQPAVAALGASDYILG